MANPNKAAETGNTLPSTDAFSARLAACCALAIRSGWSPPQSDACRPMICELPELRVTVDRVLFAPHLDAPPERPYPFIYFITIHNESKKTVTIKGRKWVVTDAQNQTVVVEGQGVVGKFPTLSPGETFSYNSYHVTASDSLAEGAFLALTEDGVAVFAKIPSFSLMLPKGGG